MAFETIVVETQGHVGTIKLDRTESLNALNATLLSEIATAVGRFDDDDSIGAIVITGNEKAFAAGADIKEMAERTYPAPCKTTSWAGHGKRFLIVVSRSSRQWPDMRWAAVVKSRSRATS